MFQIVYLIFYYPYGIPKLAKFLEDKTISSLDDKSLFESFLEHYEKTELDGYSDPELRNQLVKEIITPKTERRKRGKLSFLSLKKLLKAMEKLDSDHETSVVEWPNVF